MEKFYSLINSIENSQTKKFSTISGDLDSYLEDVEMRPKLVEYQPESISEFEFFFDSFCDSSIKDMKKECSKIYLKEYMRLEKAEKSQLEEEKLKKGVIPTYIYIF